MLTDTVGFIDHSQPFRALKIVQMKHHLLYLEIRVACLFRECLQQEKSSSISDEGLQTASAVHKTIGHQLYHSLSAVDLPNCDRSLENLLIDLYQSRVGQLERLDTLLKKMGAATLQNSLEEILFRLDRLICILNAKEDLDKGQLQAWENTVDRFHAAFSLAFNKKKLKDLWGSNYSRIFRKAEILMLYITWEEVLQKGSRRLMTEEPKLHRFHAAIKIKNLLQTDKKLFFRGYFRNRNAKLSALKHCVQSFQPEPGKMFMLLALETEKVKARIFSCEMGLLSKIDRMSQVFSAVFRWFTDNPYTRTADFLVESQEKMTREWQRVPVLSVPLDTSFQMLSKGMAGLGLFTLDLAQWKWLGVSQKMLQTISQRFTLSTDTWISGFQKFGCDEKTTVQFLPMIDAVAEYISFVAISGCSLGFSSSIIWQASLSYGLGIAAVTLVGKLVDLIYARAQGNLATSASYSFTRGVAQMITFPLVSTYVLPHFLKSAISYSGPLFVNHEACSANQKLCQEEACKMLGLTERVSGYEVNRAFRQLAKQYHPDHNPTGNNMFMLITAAKDVCLKKV